jgi:hypothetical protein
MLHDCGARLSETTSCLLTLSSLLSSPRLLCHRLAALEYFEKLKQEKSLANVTAEDY